MTADRKSILEQASDWHSRRDAGLSENEQAELSQWLAADFSHASAFRECEATWAALDKAHEDDTATHLLHDLDRSARRRRHRTIGGTMAAVMACVLTVLYFRSPREPQFTESKANLVRAERQVLPDGSLVELNRGAEISLDYTSAQRRVRLVKGEAHFTVSKDAHRPFLVSANAVELQAVGTAFSVDLTSRGVDVIVTEGRVAVKDATDRPRIGSNTTAATDPTAMPILSAGQRASIAASGFNSATIPLILETPPTVEIDQKLAWRAPQLELSGTPLSEAVTLLNRENAVQIAIMDDHLAQTRVSGVFRADNAEGFVRLLETTYGIRAERTRDRVLLRSAQ